MRIALNSWGNIPTGLGSEARWLWKLLPFDIWLMGRHPILGLGEDIQDHRPVRVYHPGDAVDADVLVVIERGCPEEITSKAKINGAKVVVLTNPEYTSPRKAWWPQADLMVARTRQSHAHLASLGIDAPRIPVPMNLEEFPFRARTRVEHVTFTNGWGGLENRKGWPEVEKMLEMEPASIKVFSQRTIGYPATGPVDKSADLYRDADLVIMPSRFEGLGLTVLEAMACGALVAVSDADPMREVVENAYGPDYKRFLLPVAEHYHVKTSAHTAWPAVKVDPYKSVDVINKLRKLRPMEVQMYSEMGRAYVARVHGQRAAHQLWQAINQLAPRPPAITYSSSSA